jgi:hypothetical protein
VRVRVSFPHICMYLKKISCVREPAGEWTPNQPFTVFFKQGLGANFAKANFDPQGRSCPPGVKLSLEVKFSVCPSILLNRR